MATKKTTENKKPDVKVGDWIRFERRRTLVISEVRYIQKPEDVFMMIHSEEYVTDLGVVYPFQVLEVRRK